MSLDPAGYHFPVPTLSPTMVQYTLPANIQSILTGSRVSRHLSPHKDGTKQCPIATKQMAANKMWKAMDMAVYWSCWSQLKPIFGPKQDPFENPCMCWKRESKASSKFHKKRTLFSSSLFESRVHLCSRLEKPIWAVCGSDGRLDKWNPVKQEPINIGFSNAYQLSLILRWIIRSGMH